MFLIFPIRLYICTNVCIVVYIIVDGTFHRSEEDSPNDYESSSHSEEERPATQWPSVIVYPYSETKVEKNDQPNYGDAIAHPARRG